jgi:hypothetical protein
VDATLSSRIHGCISSIKGGKPAVLLAHDKRTEELAESVGIPYIQVRPPINPIGIPYICVHKNNSPFQGSSLDVFKKYETFVYMYENSNMKNVKTI